MKPRALASARSVARSSYRSAGPARRQPTLRSGRFRTEMAPAIALANLAKIAPGEFSHLGPGHDNRAREQAAARFTAVDRANVNKAVNKLSAPVTRPLPHCLPAHRSYRWQSALCCGGRTDHDGPGIDVPHSRQFRGAGLHARGHRSLAKHRAEMARHRRAGRAHHVELYRSGRWHHYYTEEKFLTAMRQAVALAERWAACAVAPRSARRRRTWPQPAAACIRRNSVPLSAVPSPPTSLLCRTHRRMRWTWPRPTAANRKSSNGSAASATPCWRCSRRW